MNSKEKGSKPYVGTVHAVRGGFVFSCKAICERTGEEVAVDCAGPPGSEFAQPIECTACRELVEGGAQHDATATFVHPVALSADLV